MPIWTPFLETDFIKAFLFLARQSNENDSQLCKVFIAHVWNSCESDGTSTICRILGEEVNAALHLHTIHSLYKSRNSHHRGGRKTIPRE